MLQTIKDLLLEYPILAPALFICLRTIPVIIPPVPGLLLDAVGVVVFGWFYGFIYAASAVIIASMISFYIGRKFREPFLGKFISIKKIHEWEDRLSGKQKFLGLIVLRFVSSPFFDIVNYVAGLTKIHPLVYFWTTVIVTVPMAFVIYYFGEVVLNAPFILISTLVIVVPLLLFRKKKKGDISMLDAG
jgi:uncharacterized membrane protein YdjX (TVP38/TMEM64 family)